MNSVQKETIKLYAKQLRVPTFNNYDKVIRQLSTDDGYEQFLIELLIIEELSYLTFNRYQSEMLFQIISERSERASVIISTNLEFSEWTQLFENEMMLAALIDRVTFRSFVLNMNCSSSYRIDSTMNND